MANYWPLSPWIEKLFRWFIAGVMIFAAIPKLSDPAAFAEIVGAYGLLPDFLVFAAACVLPLGELTAAFLLIRGRNSGLWIAAILMLLFITVLSYGIWLGLDIDCGCFGPGDLESEAFSNLRLAVVRDLLLCIPIIYCLWHRYFPSSKLIGEKQ
jgi:hypothetical protein